MYTYKSDAEAWQQEGSYVYTSSKQVSESLAPLIGGGENLSLSCDVIIDGDVPDKGQFQIDVEGLLGQLVWNYSYNRQTSAYEATTTIPRLST